VITGQVNSRTEAVIPITIYDATGQTVVIDTVIDTGFSGYLTLPPATITALQLSYSSSCTFALGDNSQVNLDLYEATTIWDGTDKDILVLASEAHPLVGMSLLKGYHIFIDAIDGGEVRIEARP